jgi:hypothetical protein
VCGEGPEGRHENPRPPATCYYRTRGNAPRQPVRPDTPACVLFIGIPTYNEATTIGVLLWRLRTVLSDVSREYEVVVYDDASTDETAEVLAPYARVLPLTLLRGAKRLGTGGAIDAIVRHVARTTRYPRRDGLLLMQADFTDSPALVPEFLRRFEGGADLIIGERASAGDAPVPVRRLFAASRWVLRPFVGISDVRDLTSSFRLARIAVLRDLLKTAGDAPVAAGDGWMAQADFLLRAAPHARRVETIPVTPTFGVRTRETRRTAWPDTVALAKWGWSHRGQRIAAKVIARTVEVPAEPSEPVEVAEPERPERPERRDRSVEPVEKRGRRERGSSERREREERGDGREDTRADGRERSARPPRAKRGVTPASGVAEHEAEAVRTEDGEPRVEAGESERSSRKRRRGKRGAKRTADTSEGVSPADAPSMAEASADAPAGESRADAMASEGPATPTTAENAPGEEREPKRRRARRGRRRRGEGRDAEGAERDGVERDGSEGDGSEGDGSEGAGANRERAGHAGADDREGAGHEGSGRDHDDERGQAESEGDGENGSAQRRRNRRGRRGGRRRSGNGGGGPAEGAAGRDDAAHDGGAPSTDHGPSA